MSTVDVKKKKGERFDSLLRRFNRRVIDSGKVVQARKIRFHDKDNNKRKQRDRALRRLKTAEKREWLRKTGQLVDERQRHSR